MSRILDRITVKATSNRICYVYTCLYLLQGVVISDNFLMTYKLLVKASLSYIVTECLRGQCGVVDKEDLTHTSGPEFNSRCWQENKW